jgi:dihydrodipicolinate synthase/N-acetylneuraminate lyase
MMAGFDGISTTNSGALPELIVNTFRAVEQGDAATARDCISCGTRIGRWRANTVSRSW